MHLNSAFVTYKYEKNISILSYSELNLDIFHNTCLLIWYTIIQVKHYAIRHTVYVISEYYD